MPWNHTWHGTHEGTLHSAGCDMPWNHMARHTWRHTTQCRVRHAMKSPWSLARRASSKWGQHSSKYHRGRSSKLHQAKWGQHSSKHHVLCTVQRIETPVSAVGCRLFQLFQFLQILHVLHTQPSSRTSWLMAYSVNSVGCSRLSSHASCMLVQNQVSQTLFWTKFWLFVIC